MRPSTVQAGKAATEDGRHERRRRWAFSRKQVALALGWVTAPAILATIIAWAILLLVWGPLGERVAVVRGSADPQALYWEAVGRVLATTGLLAAVFSAIAFLAALVMSRRVAGPLCRMGDVARKVGEGDLAERLHVRRTDVARDVVPEFNAMLDKVETRMRRYERLLRNLDDILSAADPADAERTAQRLKQALAVIRRTPG
jgi:methyl-accepting chemotaxis protein